MDLMHLVLTIKVKFYIKNSSWGSSGQAVEYKLSYVSFVFVFLLFDGLELPVCYH